MKKLLRAWEGFWFGVNDLTALEAVRILLGAGLVVHYIGLIPALPNLYGEMGLVSAETALAYKPAFQLPCLIFSIHRVSDLYLFHAVFILACLFFTVGFKTSWAKWAVWYGHYNYFRRNPFCVYGVDRIVLAVLFILCIAPIGKAIGFDALKKSKRSGPSSAGWGSVCLRLLQIQLTLIYFFSGAEKLRGEVWWSGMALWTPLLNPEFMSLTLAKFFASAGWLLNLITYAGVLTELAYPFLVWNRSVRFAMVLLAIGLHAGIAAMLDLRYFSFVMAVINLSFVDGAFLRRMIKRYGQELRDRTPAKTSRARKAA